jgi:hypothetical protein
MEQLTDKKPLSIDELLEARKYNPNYEPNKEDKILSIGGRLVGSLSNFCIFSGLPKAGKSSYLMGAIASSFIHHEIFSMKINFPTDRRKICLFDTESSDYDFYMNLKKIKSFSGLITLPNYFNAYQVREDGSGIIRKMIERYLELNTDCSVIIVDGLLDLLVNYNDERESSLLTKWLKKITKQYNILLISVLHQSKSNLSTTGHIGANSDRFAQSTLDIVKDKEKNTYILTSRFMRSDIDFEPVTLMNFNGVFQQVDNDGVKPTGKKASDLDKMESKRICSQIVTIPMLYSDILDEIKERTAESTTYAKQLLKIWINEKMIIKNHENKYQLF